MESQRETDPPGPAEVAPPLAGGRYRLRDVLGEGGMATVYLAWDSRLGVERAIKVLAPALSSRKDLRARFEAEARTMARLSHPNVVAVQDVVEDGQTVFMVMEVVRGGTLWDWVESCGPMPESMALRVLRIALDAVGAAHAMGVVHRDLKPQNILLSGSGTPKISDFGIAQVQDSLRDHARTRTGAVMGTWGFMSPEQRTSARRVDGRGDIYAMGATLYALVTGKVPIDLFAADMDDSLLQGLSSPVADIIRHATRYQPEQRFPDVASLIEAVEAAIPLLPEPPPDTPRLGRRFGGGATEPPSAPSDTPRLEVSGTLAELLEPAAPRPIEVLTAATGPGHRPPGLGGPILESEPSPPRRAAPFVISGLVAIALLGIVSLFALRTTTGPEAPKASADPARIGAPIAGGLDAEEPNPSSSSAPVSVGAPPPNPEAPAVTSEAANAHKEGAPPHPGAGRREPGADPHGGQAGAPTGDGSDSDGPSPAEPPQPPTDPAPAAAAPEPAMVSIAGNVDRVVFVDDGGVVRNPGALPAGTHTVRAVFTPGSDLVLAGKISLSPGEHRTLQCTAAFQKCQ